VRFFAETLAGARKAWSLKGCRNPILAIAAVAVVASPFITLVPAMAIIALHSGKIGTTWLVTAQGVGAVCAALTLPIVAKRTSRILVLRGSITALAASLVLYAIAPSLVFAMVAMVFLGGSYMGALAGLNTSVQMHAPLAERSRIVSLYTLSLSMFYPLGAFIQADLARSFGVRDVTFVSALVLAVALLAMKIFKPEFWSQMGAGTVETPLLLAD
jgi:predicted MFS family arabinose efflux permease